MVNHNRVASRLLQITLVLCGMSSGTTALALFSQTGSDLERLEEALRYDLETDPSLATRALPMLVATPVHHWVESRKDFGPEAIKILSAVFPEKNDLINCPDCDAWRLSVQTGQGLLVDNGELSLSALGRLKQSPRYGKAKSVAYLAETPAGVQLRIVELSDGRILYDRLADSSERLHDVQPYLHYEEERDRRLRGDALSYVFLNLGLVPNGLVQAEYLEQWGDHNQHISGIGLSLINPNIAIGAVYHYLIPGVRRLNIAGSLYFPLQNAFQTETKNQSATSIFTGQVMLQYAFANSYAVFASVSSVGQFSVGFNFYNPLFMPFLL